ncbi:hypothetical protein CDV31_009988 [Fusarium ambrosium]|uniref:Uncharacterized protein n=1 Tax=Fusarium ambrosium TaxID=131363 RepID=A0A428TR37_9HYPO|nr:hypothetical protein CDV31_009988 [Fusarium ambrosium]
MSLQLTGIWSSLSKIDPLQALVLLATLPEPTLPSPKLSQHESIAHSSHFLKEKLLNHIIIFKSWFLRTDTMRRFHLPRARPWHPSNVSKFLLKISYFALGTVLGGKGVENLWYTLHRASPKYYLVSAKGSRRTPIRASMAAVASSEYKMFLAFEFHIPSRSYPDPAQAALPMLFVGHSGIAYRHLSYRMDFPVIYRGRSRCGTVSPTACHKPYGLLQFALPTSPPGATVMANLRMIPIIFKLISVFRSALLLRQFRQTENLVESLAKSLKDLVQSSKSWNASTNSFFVKVTSKDESLFSFHHTADSLEETGVHRVISSFIYRVASVTKIFTVLALLLQNNLDLDDPASKYVPEMFRIKHYKERKLRRKYAFDLATSLVFEALRALGFLEAPPMPGAPVYDTADTRPKTCIEFSESLKDHNLTWKPGQRAASFNSGLHHPRLYLSEPLSLPSATGFVLQDLPQAVLPPDRGSELMSIPSEAMTQQPGRTKPLKTSQSSFQVSSATTSFPPLKPTSRSSLPRTSRPLEAQLALPERSTEFQSRRPPPQPVDVYTKAGDSVLPVTYIAIIPEYDVRITTDVTRPDSYAAGRDPLNLMVQGVVLYFENLARKRSASTPRTTETPLFSLWTRVPETGVQSGRCMASLCSRPGQRSTAAISSISTLASPPAGENERRRVANWFSIYQFWHQGLLVGELDFVGDYGVTKGLKVPDLTQYLSKASEKFFQLRKHPQAHLLTSFSYQPQATPSKKMCEFDVAPSRMVCGHHGPDELLRMRWCNETRPCGDYKLNHLGLTRKRDPCIDCILDRRWVLANGRWRKFSVLVWEG